MKASLSYLALLCCACRATAADPTGRGGTVTDKQHRRNVQRFMEATRVYENMARGCLDPPYRALARLREQGQPEELVEEMRQTLDRCVKSLMEDERFRRILVRAYERFLDREMLPEVVKFWESEPGRKTLLLAQGASPRLSEADKQAIASYGNSAGARQVAEALGLAFKSIEREFSEIKRPYLERVKADVARIRQNHRK